MRRALGVRLVLVMGVVLGAVGCSFDSAVPERAEVACGKDGSCPAGYQCRAAIGKCIPAARIDPNAPALANAVVSPALGGAGTHFTATFQSTKALGLPPQVTLETFTGATRHFTLEAADGGASPAFRFGYTAVGDEGEGQAAVLVDLVDDVGNQAFRQVAGHLTLQFTGPVVLSESVVVPDQPGASPKQVRPGSALSVRLDVSAEVPADGGISIVLAPEGVAPTMAASLPLSSSAGGVADFAGLAPTQAETATYALCVQGLRDLAGNAARPGPLHAAPAASTACAGLGLALPDEIEVVASPPQVAIDRVYRAGSGDGGGATAFSAVPGYDQLGVDFRVWPAPASLAVALGAARLPGCDATSGACGPDSDGGLRCSCSYAVDPDAGAVEGTQEIAVLAQDLAGNLGRASAVVVLDFTPPRLLPGSASLEYQPLAGNPLFAGQLQALGPLGQVAVHFGLDEATAGSPTLGARPAVALSFQETSQVGTLHTFVGALASGASASGCEVITVSATDLVGNAGTFDLTLPAQDAGACPAQLSLDAVAPPGPDVNKPLAVQYQRAFWGDPFDGGGPDFQVRGAPESAAAGDWVLVVNQNGLEVARGQVQGDGSFGPIGLDEVDRQQVWVVEVDPAGNASAPARVRDVRWIAAPGVPNGSNPHRVGLRQVHVPWLVDSLESSASPGAPGAGAGVQVSGAASWRVLDQGYDGFALPIDRTFAPAYNSATGELRQFTTFADTQGLRDGQWLYQKVVPPVAQYVPSVGALTWDTRRGVGVYVAWQGPDTEEYDTNPATWEWSGGDWVPRSAPVPADGPLQRCGFGLTYDAWRGRTLLFGGLGTDGVTTYDDLWAWDGSAWTEVDTGAGPRPPARYGAALSFDTQRGVAVLFGGAQQRLDVDGGQGALSDTWEFDGAAWQQVTTSAGPMGGAGCSASFDPGAAQTLLVASNGLWSRGSGDWSRLPEPPGLEMPGADAGNADPLSYPMLGCGLPADSYQNDGVIAWLAPMPALGQLALVGQFPTPDDSYSESVLWLRQDGGWVPHRPGPTQACWGLGAMANDPQGRLAIQGGLCKDAAGSMNTLTELWDGVSWTELTDPPGMTGIRTGLTWDGQGFLRVAGEDGDGGLVTGIWRLADGGWQSLPPLPDFGDGGIAPREMPLLTLDPLTGQVILGAGCQDNPYYVDLPCYTDAWSFDPSALTWSYLGELPYVWNVGDNYLFVSQSNLFFDPVAQRMQFSVTVPDAPDDDYVLDADGGWRKVSSTRSGANGTAFDQVRARTLSDNGDGTFSEWDGAAWVSVPFQDARESGLLVSDLSAAGPNGLFTGAFLEPRRDIHFQLAELQLATTAPSVVFQVTTASMGIPLDKLTGVVARARAGADSSLASDGGWSPASGASLALWLNGAWRTLGSTATNQAGSAAPAELLSSATDPATLMNVSADLNQVNVAVLPVGQNGQGWATVQVNDLALELDYRLDP